MKKNVFFVCFLIFVLLLVACNNEPTLETEKDALSDYVSESSKEEIISSTEEPSSKENPSTESSETPVSSKKPETSSKALVSSKEVPTSSEASVSSEKTETSSKTPVSSKKPEMSSKVPVSSKEVPTSSEVSVSSDKPETSSKTPVSSKKPETSSKAPVSSEKVPASSEVPVSSIDTLFSSNPAVSSKPQDTSSDTESREPEYKPTFKTYYTMEDFDFIVIGETHYTEVYGRFPELMKKTMTNEYCLEYPVTDESKIVVNFGKSEPFNVTNIVLKDQKYYDVATIDFSGSIRSTRKGETKRLLLKTTPIIKEKYKEEDFEFVVPGETEWIDLYVKYPTFRCSSSNFGIHLEYPLEDGNCFWVLLGHVGPYKYVENVEIYGGGFFG